MKTKTLKKPTSVKEVLHYLSEIPNLHEGGCAISAIAIKRWLKKNKNIEASIVYRCNNEYDFLQNKKALQGLDNPTSCSHAFIKIKNVYFDAEDTEIFRDSSCLIMPEEVVIESLNNAEWNDSFNRKHVYDIEQNLQIDLSDIER